VAASALGVPRGQDADIVLSGDSTATTYAGFQRPARSAYIAVVRRALAAEGTRVLTLAQPARSVDASLADIDRIVAVRPTTVVLAHGGWESTLRLPHLLDKLRCYPFGVRGPAGQPFRLLAVRRPLWSAFVAFAGRRPGHPLLRAVGVRAQMTADVFGASAEQLVDQLLARTDARIVLVAPALLRVTTNPVDRRVFHANRLRLHSVAGRHDRVTIVDPHGLLERDRYWMADGVHLSADGHAAVAAMLLPALRVASAAVAV
jgi:hypothetical protein